MFFNIPTLLTWTRIVAIPLDRRGVLPRPRPHATQNLVATVAVRRLFALTDWLDGYLARRLNQTSSFGAFLDPVADKFLVCAALLVLVHCDASTRSWPSIIIGREIAISALREWMAQIGASRSVAVHMLGKVKTVVQMIAIPFLLYRRHAVRHHRHAAVGHLADLRRCGADHLVDGLLPAEGAARDPRQAGEVADLMTIRRDEASSPDVRAMPAVFVLIWSTGFIVARFGMPHAPPMTFLALRYALSVAASWSGSPSRRAMAGGRRQWLHLAVTGVLMHAGYLGGVWAAVKLGMGAGLAALLVGLQPVLTAVWMYRDAPAREAPVSRRASGSACCSAWPDWRWWSGTSSASARSRALNFVAGAARACSASRVGTLYQKRFVAPCDVRTANPVQLVAAFVVDAAAGAARSRADATGMPKLVGAWPGRCWRPDAGRQFAALPVDPARRGNRGDQPDVPGAAVHRGDGVAAVRRGVHAVRCGGHGARPCVGVALVVRRMPRAEAPRRHRT